ncbi:MAG: DNA-binding protein [Dehalococcoidia bacterium]|nr:DNA-binding protein [Dehalococcoidia bacterium]
MHMDVVTQVLTVEEARQILRLGRSGIYDAIKRGEAPILRFGRRIVIPRAALERMLVEASLISPK